MYRILFALTCLASGIYGRRMQSKTEKPESNTAARTRELAAAFNPSIPKGRALGGDFSLAGSRSVFLDAQTDSGQRVPAGPLSRATTVNRFKPKFNQALEHEEEDHLHPSARNLHSRLKSATKKFKHRVDQVDLYRLIRAHDGIGVNNRTLYQVLKELKKDAAQGAWQLSIDLLQAVEAEAQSGTSYKDYQREKTFNHIETQGIMGDPTEGVSLDAMSGSWIEKVVDPNEKMDSSNEEDVEEWTKVVPKHLVYTNPDGYNPLPVVYVDPVEAAHYNLVLSSCGLAGRWREALDLLKRMRERKIRCEARTYNLVLSVLEKEGRSKLAVSVLEQMFREPGIDQNADSFAYAIGTCVQADETHKAMYFIHQAFDSGVRLSRNFYAKAINACKKNGDWSRAVMLLHRMNFEGETASVSILNSVMSAFARAGEADGCERFMREEFSEHGFEPDHISYNTLLSAYAKARPPQIVALQEVMAEMEALADTGNEAMRPNTFSYNHLIYALSREERSEEALEVLFQKMPKHGINADLITYSSVANACSVAGDWEGAMSVIEKAKQDGVKLNNIAAYALVVNVTASAGRWAEACQMLDTISRKGIFHNPTTVNTALMSCVDAGNADAARTGVSSLRRLLRKYWQAADDGKRGKAIVPLPWVDRETALIARSLMDVAGDKDENEKASLVARVQDAAVQVKREKLKYTVGRGLTGKPRKEITSRRAQAPPRGERRPAYK